MDTRLLSSRITIHRTLESSTHTYKKKLFAYFPNKTICQCVFVCGERGGGAICKGIEMNDEKEAKAKRNTNTTEQKANRKLD